MNWKIVYIVLLVGVLSVPIGPMTGTVAAFGNGSDTFEDDIIGLCPEAPDDFYVAGNCGTSSRIVNNCVGRTGLCFDSSIATTGAGSEGFFDVGSNCESPLSPTFNFDFYMAGLPASGNTYNLNFRYFTTGTNAGAVGIRISGAGDYWASVYEAGAPTTQAGAGNVLSGLVAATWYSGLITVNGDLCTASPSDPAVLTISIDGGSTSNTLVTNFGSGVAALRFQPRRTTATANQAITIDNFAVSGLQQSIGGAATTSAFPAGYTLKGFDLDYMQRAPIARLVHTDGTNKIYAFDPISLGIRGLTPLDNSCDTPSGRQDGVMSTWQDPPGLSYTGFVDCQTDPLEVDTVSIRDGSLETPSHTGTICDPAASGVDNDFCSIDLQSTNDDNCPTNGEINTDTKVIAQVQAIPISWRAFHNEAGSTESVDIGFAYSTAASVAGTGRVGVWVTSQHNDVPDTSCFVEISYGGAGNQAADQICSWRNPSGDDFITAVSSANPTVTWRVDFTTVENVFIFTNRLNTLPSLTQVSQLPSMYGVGCNSFSNETLLMSGTGTINRFRTTGANVGTKVWAEDITDAATSTVRGVTMSQNGRWGAYIKTGGTEWAVFNATNGEILGNGDVPSGTFKEIKISGNGQDLYIATSTQIQRFHVATVTTIDDLPDNCLGPGDGEQCPDTFNSNSTLGVPGAPPDVGDNFGPGCFQTFNGEIVVGVTYVPLGSWTNCASMAFETMLTVIFLVAGIGFAQFKIKGEVDGRFLLFAGILGCFISIFLWQFPIWPFVVAAAGWLVLALVARRNSGGAQA